MQGLMQGHICDMRLVLIFRNPRHRNPLEMQEKRPSDAEDKSSQSHHQVIAR